MQNVVSAYRQVGKTNLRKYRMLTHWTAGAVVLFGMSWFYLMRRSSYGVENISTPMPLSMSWSLLTLCICNRTAQVATFSVFLVCLQLGDSRVHNLLSMPHIVWLGERSILMYLLHVPIAQTFSSLWFVDGNNYSLSYLILLFVLTVKLIDSFQLFASHVLHFLESAICNPSSHML